MAKTTKKSTKTTKKAQPRVSDEGKVTRIKAKDSAPSVVTKSRGILHRLTSREKADAETVKHLEPAATVPSETEEMLQKAEKQSSRKRKPLRALSEYIRGAWYELRQVRWPDRATTWQMTGALLIFTIFIGGIIVLLDMLFSYLFELMIG